MLKADSNDTTFPTTTDKPATAASLEAPADAVSRLVADPEKPLNSDAELKKPVRKKERSKMSRRKALKSAGAVGLELAAHTAIALAPRRNQVFRPRSTMSQDPIFATLEEYRQAAADALREAVLYEDAEQKLPVELRSEPRIVLHQNGPGRPPRFARSHLEIDQFIDEISRDYPEKTLSNPASLINTLRADYHQTLQLATERYASACREGGFDVIRDRFRTSLKREADAIDAIARTLPTTVFGASALAAFLQTVVTQNEIEDPDLVERLCQTLVRALSAIAGERVPKVTPYLYSSAAMGDA